MENVPSEDGQVTWKHNWRCQTNLIFNVIALIFYYSRRPIQVEHIGKDQDQISHRQDTSRIKMYYSEIILIIYENKSFLTSM